MSLSRILAQKSTLPPSLRSLLYHVAVCSWRQPGNWIVIHFAATVLIRAMGWHNTTLTLLLLTRLTAIKVWFLTQTSVSLDLQKSATFRYTRIVVIKLHRVIPQQHVNVIILSTTRLHSKGNLVPPHTMQAYRGSEGTDPHIPNFGIRRRWMVKFIPDLFPG
jgi:hypothetical protein